MARYTIVFRSQDAKVRTEEISPWLLFHEFITRQVSTLVDRRLIEVGEYYKSHITPRYDDKPEFGREIVYTETPERPWVELDGRPGWRSEPQRQGLPMRYFTLTLCTTPRGFVYRSDFPLSVLDRTIVQLPSEAERNRWTWEVIARGETEDTGTLPLYSDDLSLSIIIFLGSSEPDIRDSLGGDALPISIEEDGSSPSSQESWEISVEPVEVDLPVRPSIQEPRQTEGTPYPGELEIFVVRSTLESIIHECMHRPRNEITGGGLLIGEAFRDETSGGMVTYITGSISATRDIERKLGMHWFSGDAWEAMHQIKKQRFPSSMILGWYHDHWAGTWPSEDDEFIHNNFFRSPWHTMLIVDGKHGTRQFYYRKGDDHIVPSRAFHILK